ncbi:MAG: hypothetical protein IJE90_06660 [Clostridia bacterium]|nr:hypothetical protein [Clostridia bacterium]
MKKFLPLLLCVLFLLPGCGFGGADGTVKLQFEVIESTVTSAGLKCVIKNTDDRKAVWSYGAAFSIEKQDENGWTQQKFITPEPPLWIMIGYSVNSGKTSRPQIDWTPVYGELSPGNYRIAKEFTRTEGDTTEKHTLYANFTVK